MHIKKKIKEEIKTNGFALPSVLIASIIMLTVLLVAVTSTAAVRVALVGQYYNQLSQTAADAGAVYAQSCLDANNGIPLWSDLTPLMPNTDCAGTQLTGFTCPDNSVDARCSVMIQGNVKSSFSIGLPTLDENGKATIINPQGITSLLRESTNVAWRTYIQKTYEPVSFTGIIKNDLVMNLDAGDPDSYSGSGTVWNDTSDNGNNGSLKNGVSYSSSNGGALSFDGVNDYVNITNTPSLQLTGSSTIEFWFKPSNLAAGRQNVLDKAYGGEFATTLEPAGNMSYFYGTNGGRDNPYQGLNMGPIVQDAWQDVTIVRDLSGMVLYCYINGTLVHYTAALYVNAVVSSFDVTVGFGYTSVYYSGLVGAVRMYNRALSTAEVQQNYKAASSRYYDMQVQVLVVAGGGSGGTSTSGSGGGGGGGAGGLIYSPYRPVTPKAYAVTVGGGGASMVTASTRGNSGGNSSFDSLVALGGGGGGRGSGGNDSGGIGGSGGGAGYNGYTFLAGAVGTSIQGFDGGDTLSNNNGGGGGGAGGSGGNTNSGGPSGAGGVGGIGVVNSISGSPVTYAKGGEGGAPPSGLASGAANTGNGGSGVYAGSGSSGAGGSGVVIISYPTGAISATGGTITYSSGRTIHKFTTSGTFTVN